MKPKIGAPLLVIAVLALGIAALSCGKDDPNPVAPPGGGGDVTIDIVADSGPGAFGAAPVTVQVGQKVAWRNTRGTLHTATSTGGPAAGQWDTGGIGGGATSAAIQMNTPGTFPYKCNIHPDMTGTLIVQ